jgi:hypothetical protein
MKVLDDVKKKAVQCLRTMAADFAAVSIVGLVLPAVARLLISRAQLLSSLSSRTARASDQVFKCSTRSAFTTAVDVLGLKIYHASYLDLLASLVTSFKDQSRK